MTDIITSYFHHVKDIAHSVYQTQKKQIIQAANIFSKTVQQNHTIFSFGASHAGILTEELFYRTGGLALINPILAPSLMLNARPITTTSKMERLPGLGKIIFSSIPAKKGDTLFIHSVSGRNPVSIEMALSARHHGLNTIALTNLNYSQQVTSRDLSGKRLFEVCDIVIDNCGDFEDSSMQLDGLEQKMGPTSTIIGALIVNMIVMRTVDNLLQQGITPPVFHSANIDGGDAFNAEIMTRFKDRIYYM